MYKIFMDTKGALKGASGATQLGMSLKKYLFPQASTHSAQHRRAIDAKVNINVTCLGQNNNGTFSGVLWRQGTDADIDIHNLHGMLGYVTKDLQQPWYTLWVIGDSFSAQDFKIGRDLYRDKGSSVVKKTANDILRPTNLAVRAHTFARVAYPNNQWPDVARILYDFVKTKARVISTDFAKTKSGALDPQKLEIIINCMNVNNTITVSDTTRLFFDTTYPLRTAHNRLGYTVRDASDDPEPAEALPVNQAGPSRRRRPRRSDSSGSSGARHRRNGKQPVSEEVNIKRLAESDSGLDINTPAPKRRRPPPAHDDDDDEPNLLCSEELEDA